MSRSIAIKIHFIHAPPLLKDFKVQEQYSKSNNIATGHLSFVCYSVSKGYTRAEQASNADILSFPDNLSVDSPLIHVCIKTGIKYLIQCSRQA